jgi:xanthine dehydrogenase accessory factor
MTDALLEALREARRSRTRCALVTIAATRGSVPRQAGSKMLVFFGGKISGTIGGGKFEALVVEESLAILGTKTPLLKSYPLHEGCVDSFGAICGGEVTVLIEPQVTGEALFLIGAGHCAQAIAKLAAEAGLHVTVWDDRENLASAFPGAAQRVAGISAPEFITGREWSIDEALVLVSRNHEIDTEALAAALTKPGAGYLGMIGSRRKVLQVFDRLKARGFSDEALAQVYAPLGLDIGADSPAEIAISVLAEILQVLRKRSGDHLRRLTPGS